MALPEWDAGWPTSREEFLRRCDADGTEPSLNREKPWLWGEQSQLLAEAGAIAARMEEQVRIHAPDDPSTDVVLAAKLIDMAAASIRYALTLMVDP